jgi:hypothetical protein
MKELPPLGQVGFLGLSMYFSEGYQALAMCLEEPWVPCYGIGNSYFLERQAQRLTGVDSLWKRSYPARIERRGWDSEGLWSSIYPWIASDLSFPGSLGAIFMIGWLFARVWRDVLVGENPFAVALFAQLVLMVFYFPANNQIMQSGEGLSAFLVTLIVWRWTRNKDSVPSSPASTRSPGPPADGRWVGLASPPIPSCERPVPPSLGEPLLRPRMENAGLG